jgi:hypothetical protein
MLQPTCRGYPEITNPGHRTQPAGSETGTKALSWRACFGDSISYLGYRVMPEVVMGPPYFLAEMDAWHLPASTGEREAPPLHRIKLLISADMSDRPRQPNGVGRAKCVPKYCLLLAFVQVRAVPGTVCNRSTIFAGSDPEPYDRLVPGQVRCGG